jgi:hypothetical protein
MASGRTVEETVLLALVVQPSPRKRVPSGLGLACYQATSTPRRARHNIVRENVTNHTKTYSTMCRVC